MKKVYAILHEPASYTVDRNRAVYDRMGIRYCYMNRTSLAKSDCNVTEETLGDMSIKKLFITLKNILRQNDIIIMNGYTGRIFLILYFLNIFYRKSIGIDSDTPLNVPEQFLKRLCKKIYLGAIFRNKNIYGLPGGKGSHSELFRHYGMKDNNIFLMPMMVDNRRFSIPPRKNFTPFVFLYVGRIISIKNIETMIKAFLREYEGNDNVRLRIVGQGEEEESLKSKYDTQNNISFAGAKYDEELKKEYADAHAFILPSSFEPWGLVVNEAMSAGLPVIVSDKVGAAWDLVKNRNTGFIFNHENVEALQMKMKKLVDDNKTYKELANNAFHLLNDEWNYDFYRRCLELFVESV